MIVDSNTFFAIIELIKKAVDEAAAEKTQMETSVVGTKFPTTYKSCYIALAWQKSFG